MSIKVLSPKKLFSVVNAKDGYRQLLWLPRNAHIREVPAAVWPTITDTITTDGCHSPCALLLPAQFHGMSSHHVSASSWTTGRAVFDPRTAEELFYSQNCNTQQNNTHVLTKHLLNVYHNGCYLSHTGCKLSTKSSSTFLITDHPMRDHASITVGLKLRGWDYLSSERSE